jgi:hypothetical protein
MWILAELRRGWREEIAKIDGMIAHLEEGNKVHSGPESDEKATGPWSAETQLRKGWREEIAKIDGLIAHLEKGDKVHSRTESDERATELWSAEIRRRRAVLESLLFLFPE